MSVFVAGLSYKTAPVALREQLAVSPSKLGCHGCRLRVVPTTTALLLERAVLVPGQAVPLFEVRPPVLTGDSQPSRRERDASTGSANSEIPRRRDRRSRPRLRREKAAFRSRRSGCETLGVCLRAGLALRILSVVHSARRAGGPNHRRPFVAGRCLAPSRVSAVENPPGIRATGRARVRNSSALRCFRRYRCRTSRTGSRCYVP